jgi:hypothetical protein
VETLVVKRKSRRRDQSVGRSARECGQPEGRRKAETTSVVAAQKEIHSTLLATQTGWLLYVPPIRFQSRFFIRWSFLFSISESFSPIALISRSQSAISERDRIFEPRSFIP